MELEVVSRKKTDSKKVKKGKTSESQGYVFQLENEDEGITASIKSCDDLFEVGDTVEMEIDSHQSRLAPELPENLKKGIKEGSVKIEGKR